MAGNGSNRGGYRMGSGRKRVKPVRGRCAEIQRVVDGVYKGLALASLRFLPDGSDEELIELSVSAIVADEVQRGRGAEVLRLLGNLQGVTGRGGAEVEEDAGAAGGSMLTMAMASLPGLEGPGAGVADGGGAEVEEDRGLTVREIARALRSHSGEVIPGAVGAFGSGQDELFELSPGVSISGRH